MMPEDVNNMPGLPAAGESCREVVVSADAAPGLVRKHRTVFLRLDESPKPFPIAEDKRARRPGLLRVRIAYNRADSVLRPIKEHEPLCDVGLPAEGWTHQANVQALSKEMR